MIRKSDVQWWVLEAKKHPESAPTIVEALSQRLIELDVENERLRDEVIHLEHQAPATAASDEEVSTLRRKVDALQSLLNGDASNEPSVVLLSTQLQSTRLPLSQVQRLAREEQPAMDQQALLGLRSMLLARPQDELLLLTSHGRGLKMQLSDVPLLAEEQNWPAAKHPVLEDRERLTAAVAVGAPPRFWTLVTRRGFVRQLLRIDLDRRIERGETLLESPFERDFAVALVDGDQGDLLLITRWGKWTRFAHRAIESQGSTALELEPDDEIVAAVTLTEDVNVAVVTAAGYGIRRNTSQFAARSRPGGSGKALIQAFDVLNAFPCKSEDRLFYLTYSGKLAQVAVADIPLYTQSAKGARLRTFDRDPAVAVTLITGTQMHADSR